jgi:hypothetical protein
MCYDSGCGIVLGHCFFDGITTRRRAPDDLTNDDLCRKKRLLFRLRVRVVPAVPILAVEDRPGGRAARTGHDLCFRPCGQVHAPLPHCDVS